MSVNIINVDGKCITRVMRDFADFLATTCCRVEKTHDEMEEEDVAPSVPGDRRSLCGLGTTDPSEDEWGPDLKELQNMIEALKASHAQEIENLKTEVMDTFVNLEVQWTGDSEEIKRSITEIKSRMVEVDLERLRNEKVLSKKVNTLEEKRTNLEDVIGGLSSDILLNSDEIGNLKEYALLTSNEVDKVKEKINYDSDDFMTEDETEA